MHILFALLAWGIVRTTMGWGTGPTITYLEQNLAACVGEGCALRSAYTLHMSVRCGGLVEPVKNSMSSPLRAACSRKRRAGMLPSSDSWLRWNRKAARIWKVSQRQHGRSNMSITRSMNHGSVVEQSTWLLDNRASWISSALECGGCWDRRCTTGERHNV